MLIDNTHELRHEHRLGIGAIKAIFQGNQAHAEIHKFMQDVFLNSHPTGQTTQVVDENHIKALEFGIVAKLVKRGP
nr:hypothetical protein [Herpetosiphon giganteus]